MSFIQGEEYVLTEDFSHEEHYLDKPLIIPKGTILKFIGLYDSYNAQFFTKKIIPTYFYVHNIIFPKDFWNKIASISDIKRRTEEEKVCDEDCANCPVRYECPDSPYEHSIENTEKRIEP